NHVSRGERTLARAVAALASRTCGMRVAPRFVMQQRTISTAIAGVLTAALIGACGSEQHGFFDETDQHATGGGTSGGAPGINGGNDGHDCSDKSAGDLQGCGC